MRHFAAGGAPGKDLALAQLVAYLHATGSKVSVDDALGMAIDTWLAAEKARTARIMADGTAKGSQWKCLFLPDTTQIRMHADGRTEYAEVAGDAILHRGRKVSPRGLTLVVAGEGRNAWRELLVRRPGDAGWQRASVLRARIERAAQQAQPQPATPVERMAAAARCMSDALRSALAVVEHVNVQAAQQHERRAQRHRRADDTLGEDCALD
ncbi:hypothetical protein IV454_00325 [Massilia antarctica]|uniref:Uncharacterized protein n=1 Tax=Massilia antarctica TaxID=2765360 RepID=A0AA48WCZ7_9BURK|nr:hypothetical protein [Massilia antarctica]QPI50127.1 hypothetical protein IV454_00325 [Massilia antarctica]